MFDTIVQAITNYPYLGVALVFVLCGMGLPLPEEVVLIAGGYVCSRFPDKAALHWMIVWCAGAILTGDFIPYILGRVFGARLLRLRWLRLVVSKQKLATFDRWFRRRGDLVIFIARFIVGIRVVAFFTAGTMKMPLRRFLTLDTLGIALIVPLLVYVGYRGAGFIDDTISMVQRVERGILYAGGAVVVLLLAWYWVARTKKGRRIRGQTPAEIFVEPRVQPETDVGASANGSETAPTARTSTTSLPLEPTPMPQQHEPRPQSSAAVDKVDVPGPPPNAS